MRGDAPLGFHIWGVSDSCGGPALLSCVGDPTRARCTLQRGGRRRVVRMLWLSPALPLTHTDAFDSLPAGPSTADRFPWRMLAHYLH